MTSLLRSCCVLVAFAAWLTPVGLTSSSAAESAPPAAPGADVGREVWIDDPKQIAEASEQAQPGDVLVLADGTYRDVEILFRAHGQPGLPITLRAQTSGQVILSGTSSLRMEGRDLVVQGLHFKDGGFDGDTNPGSVIACRASYSRITECAITGYNPQDRTINYKWVSLYGRYNRVDHCYFEGQDHLGQTLVIWVEDEPNFHRVDHNHFAGRPVYGGNGGETLRIGTSQVSLQSSASVVEYNYFENCNGEVEIISNKSCDNIYRYNTFVACQGALTLRHGDRCTVEGNVFLGRGVKHTGGIRVIGEDHRIINNYFEGLRGEGARSAISIMNGVPDSPPHGYLQVKNTLVASNTIADCRSGLVVGLKLNDTQSLPPTRCTVSHNIMVARDPSQKLIEMADQAPEVVFADNLLHGPGADAAAVPDGGARLADPNLIRGDDDLLRPRLEGPAAVHDVEVPGSRYRLVGIADVGPGWLDVEKKGN